MTEVSIRKKGFYEKYIKRILDVLFSLCALVFLSPLFVVLALAVRINLGSPVFFTQERPGIVGKDGKECIFKMYKFRTMTNERDEFGRLLPDNVRLTRFGAWLRSTSLDELPELFNILNGSMSLIGPRPQLVRDMVFMSEEQRKRHTVRPGLSGYAQVNGRNTITWEEKLSLDLEYIKKISFLGDAKIVVITIGKVFKRADINRDGTVSDMDFGDYLLKKNAVSKEDYDIKQEKAKELLRTR